MFNAMPSLTLITIKTNGVMLVRLLSKSTTPFDTQPQVNSLTSFGMALEQESMTFASGVVNSTLKTTMPNHQMIASLGDTSWVIHPHAASSSGGILKQIPLI